MNIQVGSLKRALAGGTTSGLPGMADGAVEGSAKARAARPALDHRASR
jgi:hypothetical protein